MSEAEVVRTFSGNLAAATKAWLSQANLDAERICEAADERLFAMFDAHVPLMNGIEEFIDTLDLPKAVCSNSLVQSLI